MILFTWGIVGTTPIIYIYHMTTERPNENAISDLLTAGLQNAYYWEKLEKDYPDKPEETEDKGPSSP